MFFQYIIMVNILIAFFKSESFFTQEIQLIVASPQFDKNLKKKQTIFFVTATSTSTWPQPPTNCGSTIDIVTS